VVEESQQVCANPSARLIEFGSRFRQRDLQRFPRACQPRFVAVYQEDD
jgi:hypothetical protein